MKPCYAWLLLGIIALCGCATPSLRSQSPEDLSGVLESKTRLVGEVARPFGDKYVKIESVALVTCLDNSGEDPAPSAQRAALLHELQTIGVPNPNLLMGAPRPRWCWSAASFRPACRKAITSTSICACPHIAKPKACAAVG